MLKENARFLLFAYEQHGRRVVCGTQNGVLVTWPWGTWGDRSSRFRGELRRVLTGKTEGGIVSMPVSIR